jgi:hypothetical protein
VIKSVAIDLVGVSEVDKGRYLEKSTLKIHVKRE